MSKTAIEKLEASFKASSQGEWKDNREEFGMTAEIECAGHIPVIRDESELSEYLTQEIMDANLDFIARSHNMMPALLALVKAVDAEITPDSDLRTMDLSGILKAMESLKKTDNNSPKLIKNFVEGLDEAVKSVISNDYLSIYEIEVGLVNYIGGRRNILERTVVAITNDNTTDSGISPIDFCRNKNQPKLDESFEILDKKILLIGRDVNLIKSAIGGMDGITIEDSFIRATGLSCDYQGNDIWEVHGKLLNQDEITTRIVKSMCAKSPSEQSEAMSYFSDTDDNNDDGYRFIQ